MIDNKKGDSGPKVTIENEMINLDASTRLNSLILLQGSYIVRYNNIDKIEYKCM